MLLPSLPPDAAGLCDKLAAPAVLVRHLVLVHHTADVMLDALASNFPDLTVDRQTILLGAAIHDLGKVLHPLELTGPGQQHEIVGPDLLIKHGVPPRLARFARSHGRWQETNDLEDLLVAVADNVWRGRRVEELETKLAAILAAMTGTPQWAALLKLDAVCEEIAEKGDVKLAWQAHEVGGEHAG